MARTQPEYVSAAAGFARRAAFNPVGQDERADRPDGLHGGGRHERGNRFISAMAGKVRPVKPGRRRGSHLLILAGGLTLLVLSSLPVHAHARLVRSSPASRAQVEEPPERIELWFSELLENGFNSVEVVRTGELTVPHRMNLAQGASTVDPDDRTHLVVPVPRLAS